MANSVTTPIYPKEDQRDRWEERADDMGMSLSEFIQAMTEAGMKKFDASVQPDESAGELREQRNELKAELDRARERIENLETRLYEGERQTIIQFVEDNPGATFEEIGQHVADTVPIRVSNQLDSLEGEALRAESGGYYPAEE